MSTAAFIIAKQNQYLTRFEVAGATSPDTAKDLEQVGCHDSRLFQRLVRRNVIRQTPQGKYYLDIDAAQRFRRARRNRALVALIIILIIMVVVIAIFAIR
jgi:t-SNARE complex subunit (syntaxin)